MLNFEVALEKNKNYIKTPNILAKLILLRKHLEDEHCIVIIAENEKAIQNYIKINHYLYEQKIIHKKLTILDNTSQIVDIVYNQKGLYITLPSIFYNKLDIVDNPKNILKIATKQQRELSDITKKLNELGYVFKEYEDPGSFQVRGDILTFTDVNGETYKISFWGNTIEEIFHTSHQKTQNEIIIGKNKKLTCFHEPDSINQDDFAVSQKKFNLRLKDKMNNLSTLIILDSIDFSGCYHPICEGLKNFINLPLLSYDHRNDIDLGLQDLFIENRNGLTGLKDILSNKSFLYKYIFTKNITSCKNFLELNDITGVQVFECPLNNMKSFVGKNIVCICDDNLSRLFIQKRNKRSISKDMDLLLQIKSGDYIVHIDHGIGIFNHIIEKDIDSIKKEYVELEYKNNDKLFVPITEVGRLSKYVGVQNPKLTSLSTNTWEAKIKKASVDIEKIAKELLEVYAKRKLHKGFKYLSFPKEEAIFQNTFEYTYTKDQIHIIQEIFEDMESHTPMDRLVSGDVGFGKTEIAFNAIYKAMLNGKQTALISPLVVLAYEHFEKAQQRFADFPFRMGVVTRFEKEKNIQRVLEDLKTGKIDCVIGTHRLLSPDVKFKNLGLLVIDEEHKFGVHDKEKIKNLKGNIDILSLSATPIPRSLNMALNGIKSISMLTTPPPGRKPIHTVISHFCDTVIQDAGKKEFENNGQLFFIHNRVDTISHFESYLKKLFPSKKVLVTHGQLPCDTLEKRIIAFKRKEYDILLSTTVIENGIDFGNVNTIIINEAGNFGISQIHQLRGRVGRSEKQGYCYLLLKKDCEGYKIKEEAAKRLKTIVDYSHLGAGFELAIKDLEIRGGGDILGIRQSGQSVDIGVNLFLQMLENKIEELKCCSGAPREANYKINTKIDLNISLFIQDSFFSSELDKIHFYREIESLSTIEDLESIMSSFRDTYIKQKEYLVTGEKNDDCQNDLPKGTHNFFHLLRLKILAQGYHIHTIKRVGMNYQIDFEDMGEGGLQNLKRFLDLDTEVRFRVISLTRIRSERKNFTNDESFLEYMLRLLSKT